VEIEVSSESELRALETVGVRSVNRGSALGLYNE
jgi:hypothetical protein